MVFVFFMGVLLSLAHTARAQQADAGDLPPKVTGTLSNITRVESWAFFTPRPEFRGTDFGGGRPNYTFVADRFRLGASAVGARFDVGAAFDYVRLENLPLDAIGPGGLGTGAFYFAATGLSYSYQLYLRELTLRVKSRSGGVTATLGRMSAAASADAVAHLPNALAGLMGDRVDARLVGGADWSLYGRRFDGVRLDVDRARWHLMSGAWVPTQGVFEESANLSMPSVQVGSVVATRRDRPASASAPSSGAVQVFGHVYHDRRSVTARPDNTGVGAPRVDITVTTVGATRASIRPAGAGEFDMVAWAAGQAGNWYGESHRAVAASLEGGYRWPRARWQPWLRGGYWYASGDHDADDGRHGTFFEMLPSSRQYALSATYTHMNLRDAFVQARVEPGRGVTARAEWHRLDLASAADRWYQGSGATASAGRFFGFSGRPSIGATSLGAVLEASVDVPVRKYWSLAGYLASMRGGQVVRRLFADHQLWFWYVENRLGF